MADAQSTPVLHLIGPRGSGKTTLCRLFLDALTDLSVLVVDASEDAYLTLSYAIHGTVTVTRLLEQSLTTAMTREAMDWALQDLPVAVPSESDAEILVWGKPEVPFTETQTALLQYALPRLFQTYDLVIWDGPIIQQVLDDTVFSPLIVITPQDESYCQALVTSLQHPVMVLLSKAEATDSLPPSVLSQIQMGNWKFLGKLPPLNLPERRVKELPQHFQDLFHKLDLPFTLRPRVND